MKTKPCQLWLDINVVIFHLTQLLIYYLTSILSFIICHQCCHLSFDNTIVICHLKQFFVKYFILPGYQSSKNMHPEDGMVLLGIGTFDFFVYWGESPALHPMQHIDSKGCSRKTIDWIFVVGNRLVCNRSIWNWIGSNCDNLQQHQNLE